MKEGCFKGRVDEVYTCLCNLATTYLILRALAMIITTTPATMSSMSLTPPPHYGLRKDPNTASQLQYPDHNTKNTLHEGRYHIGDFYELQIPTRQHVLPKPDRAQFNIAVERNDKKVWFVYPTPLPSRNIYALAIPPYPSCKFLPPPLIANPRIQTCHHHLISN